MTPTRSDSLDLLGEHVAPRSLRASTAAALHLPRAYFRDDFSHSTEVFGGVTATGAALPRPGPYDPFLRVLLSGAARAQQVITRDLLSGMHIDVAIAQDAVEATLLLRSHIFDVILLDVDCSILDSLFVTVSIRSFERASPERRPTPVVAYTGMDPPPFAALLKSTGANDVLRKSTEAMGLSECLVRWCPEKSESRIH
jgi:CheY-like chemotaxis protein